ncbi:hypothetical protein LNV23_03930 [Paucibacter sp. DJ1R-11]|uniref:hypothetical protein n=1 Tax=unclassified Roseateles TaxID=2626991 RepID=UPI0021E43EEF|nr:MULTISPECIES: hypothetical protein [unclassified Roseateles]MCV2362597.1 hypothetical protein [Paucibacter sp. DJ1R-11]MCV2419294.1 hypothetical protein [Paucibacter sp. DJ4R-1]MCV2437802.1 hypothetical protein [Paucibacter sp. DJ2R-2]
MRKTLITRSLRVLTLLAVAAPLALPPTLAQAREGATSTGHGIKCYTWFNPVKLAWEQVCYKGV